MPATNELLQEKGVSASEFTSAPAEGDTLEELLRRNDRAFPVSDVLNWADQLLVALGELHKASPAVIHNNVRPENIVLSPDGTVSLLGAGESPSGGDAHIRFSPLEQIWDGLDAASQKVITNSYDERSEKTLKSPADARSDLYSLAATLYYLLTATPPVDALERSIEMLDGNSDPLPDPSQLNSQVPGDVSKVLLKALEIKRESRFDSAAIMRQVLRSSASKTQSRETPSETQAAEAAKAAARLAEEQKREAEEMERERLKVEEQNRRDAEQRQAEEKRRQEAAAAEAARSHASIEPSPSAEDLLELDISVMPNVEAHISAAPGDTPQDAIELSVIDDIPVPKKPLSPTSTYASAEKDFSYQEASTGGSMLSMPVMAAAAAVVIIVAVGIYFVAFSGGSSTTPATAESKPAPVQASPVTQPETPAAEPEPATAYSSDAPQPTVETAAKPETGNPAHAAAVKPTPNKEAKPANPAKEPAKGKKPVTVDDLINDN
jgi:hypothetical protein